jgi:hypothetical protein
VPVRRSINDTITRDRSRDSGETVREFDLRSAAIVLGAAIGAGFLIFYVLAFVPWLLANGMTAAVEGMMNQIGFDNFNASTLGDWILVLFVGAVFTAFIVGLVTAILWLYNLLSQRTGMGFRLAGALPAGEAPAAIEASAEPARKRARTKSSGTTKAAAAKRSTRKATPTKSASASPLTPTAVPAAVAPPVVPPVASVRLRDHPVLLVATAAVAAFEALLVVAFGPASAVPLAPQVSAPAPFGVFHDLRWLLVYHPSWQLFVVGAGVVLAARVTLDVMLVRAAWPRAVETPGTHAHVRHVVRFTALQALVLVPFAVLVFAMAVTSLSWLFFVAVPVLVMVAVLVHQGEVTTDWWRATPTRRSVAAVLAAFAVLTIAGAVLSAVPRGLAPLVAAIAGVAVAACRLQGVHALAGRPRSTRRRPFAVVGLAVVLLVVVVGTAVGFAVAVAVEAGRSPLPEVRVDAAGSPVLVVKGFNSKWEGVTRRWVRGEHRLRRFSYRGLDAAGAPEPYERSDTHQSLPALAREMRHQVAAFHEETGEAVQIVAESEGALVAQTYLASTPRAPVDALVLLSPLLAPGRVYYPPLGENGWGVVSGTLLGGIAAALGAIGPVDVSADTPLFRSIVDEGPTLGALLGCPPPRIRAFAVLPLDAGVAAPAPTDIAYPHEVVPAFHGGLLGDDTTARHVEAVLAGRSPGDGSSVWSTIGDGVNALASGWQAPDLEPSVLSQWRDLPDGDCTAVRRELRRWVARTR